MNLEEEVMIVCPQCGEDFAIQVNTAEGSYETIEDCQVCCRPIAVSIQCRPGQVVSLSIEPA